MTSGSNSPFVTEICPYGSNAIAAAARLIGERQTVAVPTETVYGLAADATNPAAVARIYEAKGRPSFNPLIVHVADMAMAQTLAQFTPLAEKLAATFWPGPLTLVLPKKPDCPVASIATAGLDTIAIRCPAHPAMRDLIRASGKPLAAPSANASGKISPTTAQHVMVSLSGRIPMILDAGPCAKGLESTIVAPGTDDIQLLRPGPVTTEEIEAALGVRMGTKQDSKISAPGQLASHYAPEKPIRLNAYARGRDAYFIGFGTMACDYNLSPSGSLVEAAARLFDALHSADASAATEIHIAPVPQEGLGIAINDRLKRAAAPL